MKKLILTFLTLVTLTACKKDILEPASGFESNKNTNRFPKKVYIEEKDSTNRDGKTWYTYKWIKFYYNNDLLVKTVQYDTLGNQNTGFVYHVVKFNYNSANQIIDTLTYDSSSTSGMVSTKVIPFKYVYSPNKIKEEYIYPPALESGYSLQKSFYYTNINELDYILYKNSSDEIVDSTSVNGDYYQNFYGQGLGDDQGFLSSEAPFELTKYSEGHYMSGNHSYKAMSKICDLQRELSLSFLPLAKDEKSNDLLYIEHLDLGFGTADFQYYFDENNRLIKVIKNSSSYSPGSSAAGYYSINYTIIY